MKRNSTQHSTSGTPPISFAAAAQKNTNKANPPTQPATTTTPATPAANPSSAAAAAAAPAAASQTPSSTATTPSSGSQAAAVNNSSSSSTSTTPSSKPASAKPATSTPATPSTANGNYSAVAAKANHAYVHTLTKRTSSFLCSCYSFVHMSFVFSILLPFFLGLWIHGSRLGKFFFFIFFLCSTQTSVIVWCLRHGVISVVIFAIYILLSGLKYAVFHSIPIHTTPKPHMVNSAAYKNTGKYNPSADTQETQQGNQQQYSSTSSPIWIF